MMHYLFWLGTGITLYLYIFTEHIKIKWDKFAQFFAFMCLLLMAQNAIHGGDSPASLADVEPYHYLLVFWEDAIFMVPIYFLMEKYGKNVYTICFAILSSLFFAYGHLYHGLFGALVTAFYPYFISHHYAKKTSIGTVMVCHITYDLMLYYSTIILAKP